MVVSVSVLYSTVYKVQSCESLTDTTLDFIVLHKKSKIFFSIWSKLLQIFFICQQVKKKVIPRLNFDFNLLGFTSVII